MQFVVAGILKRDMDQKMMSLKDEWNEHLSQPFRRITFMGVMRDKEGKRRGYLIFFEAKNWDDAESYLDQSPFYRNGLYERVDVASFDLEIGGVDELAHG